MTSVSVDLRKGLAQAMNSGAAGFAEGTAGAALDMASLGTPRAMIEQIKRQCGGSGAE